MMFRFDDDNNAYLTFKENEPVYVLYGWEIGILKETIKKLPLNDVRIIDYCETISIKFKAKADEAYFKILTADGIEILTTDGIEI
jgi:DNA polymerase III delta subunit